MLDFTLSQYYDLQNAAAAFPSLKPKTASDRLPTPDNLIEKQITE